MKLIEIKQRDKAMQITWVINNICTNACSYCPSGLHNGKNHHYEWDNAKRFVDQLLIRYPKINLSIAGGEPTLSPHLPELVKLFFDRGHTISLTSNGARSVRYYDAIAKNLNGMCFSFHPSFEEAGFMDKVIATSHYCFTTVRVMMDTRYWDRCVNFYNSIIDNMDISVEPVRIQDWGIGNTVGRDYTEEQEQWFNDRPMRPARFFEETKNPEVPMWCDYYYNNGEIDTSGRHPLYLINSKQNDFRGWECDIGLESLFIHYDGAIQRANCRQGTPTRFFGNVNQPESIIWPTQPEICSQRECHCATDIIVSKRLLLLSKT